MTGAAIRFDQVGFSYGSEMTMSFDLAVKASQIVGVMGPSGSGKSTLLHLLAGFEKPSSGRILIGGEDVTRLAPARRPISMIFQENNLFSHLDVATNVGLGRSPALKLTSQDHADIASALARTGLGGKEKRLPAELSGGERQRVALARALLRNRPVLLLDEAFASLGPALRREMLEMVRELHAEHKMTILMVTHHPDDASLLCDSIAFIEDGQVAAMASTEDMFSDAAPARFRSYIGA